MNLRVGLFGVLALSAAAAFGQQSGVIGIPYSAEQTSETVQTLADGTHITQTGPTVRMYRDSQGRTRTEMTLGGRRTGQADAPTVIQIDDPVARVHYSLFTQDHTARKVSLAAIGARPAEIHGAFFASVMSPGQRPPASADAESQRPRITTEKLGSETIDGLLVEGVRHTTVWPVGSMGNDQPITVVSETWTSPELQVTVLHKQSDPRIGETTQKLINIGRTEPDASLFQPPADYTVSEADRGGAPR